MEKKEKGIFQRMGFAPVELSEEEKLAIRKSQAKQVSTPGKKEEGIREESLLSTPASEVKASALRKAKEKGLPEMAAETIDLLTPDDLDVTSKASKLGKLAAALIPKRAISAMRQKGPPKAAEFGEARFPSDVSKPIPPKDEAVASIDMRTGERTVLKPEEEAERIAAAKKRVEENRQKMKDKARAAELRASGRIP